MARIHKGSTISGISGKIGDFVIKRYGKHTVISRVPDMSGIKATKKQKVKRNLFKEAVAYAQQIVHDPDRRAAYKKTLRRGKKVYQAAIAEYLKHFPE